MNIPFRTFFPFYVLIILVIGGVSFDSLTAKVKKNKNSKFNTSTNHSKCSCQLRVLCDIKDELLKLEDFFEKASGCGLVTTICKLPATIKKSGKYCVKKNLFYEGTGAAITVAASNVTINFNNHSLTLTDPSAVGVLANGVSELAIQNDSIQSAAISTNPSSAAFHFINCNKVSIDNIFTANTFYGILIQNSTDVAVTHARFNNHIGGSSLTASSAIRAEASTSVVIEESTFSGISPNQGSTTLSNEISFQLDSATGTVPCNLSRVSNCQFSNADLAIDAEAINGLIIENCNIEGGSTAAVSLIQLGGALTNQTASDIIIRNSTLINKNVIPAYSGIFLLSGSGCLIEDVVLDIAATRSAVLGAGADIVIGANNGGGVFSFFNNATIRNSVIQGPSTYSLEIVASTGSVVDNCQISQAQEAAIVFSNANNILIKNSTISSAAGLAGTGIFFVGGFNVQGNSIIGNVISNNDLQAVLLPTDSSFNLIADNKISQNGAGVFAGGSNNRIINNTINDNDLDGITISGSQNVVQGNSIFGNQGNGIGNVAANNQFYFNNACFNLLFDCEGIPAALTGNPGSTPITLGENICCTIG